MRNGEVAARMKEGEKRWHNLVTVKRSDS